MHILLAFLASIILLGHTVVAAAEPVFGEKPEPLAQHQIFLSDRYDVPQVNDVFRDNILLSIAYMDGVASVGKVDWNKVEKPFDYQFKLGPGQAFAFHDQVMDKYKGKIEKTTGAHFNSGEGFKSDGWLVGDGVCHLASVMYWTAKDAGLETEAPTNHDFAEINEVPRQYGVSIFNYPNQTAGGETQNLYITNNRQNPIFFKFVYDGISLAVSVYEL